MVASRGSVLRPLTWIRASKCGNEWSLVAGRRRRKANTDDDKRSKAVTAELILDVGFNPVDAGPLRIARYTEPFALLVAQLAYEREGGLELAYRFERLAR